MFKLINGDSLVELDKLEENSIDAIVTDPPYELGFMGKSWDSTGIAYNVDFWKKCLRVLKPGGHLLAFSGARTSHRMVCAIEDAGFEIRDCIMWLYGSSMPKGQNIGKMLEAKNKYGKSNSRSLRELELSEGEGSYTVSQPNNGIMGEMKDFERKYYEPDNEWKGWNSQLKPAYEPICLARKPLEGTIIENINKYGVGGINIDECKVGNEVRSWKGMKSLGVMHDDNWKPKDIITTHVGRYPSNVLHDGSDEVVKDMPYSKGSSGEANYEFGNQNNPTHLYTNIKSGNHFDDEGSVSRYYYCAKASSKDREEGLEHFAKKQMYEGNQKFGYGNANGDNFGDRIANVKRTNIHPTCKPTELMQYLVRLISPKGATILDPFMGSGSTGKAVAFENKERDANYSFIGIEMEKEYCEIAQARIDWANDYKEEITSNVKVERPKDLVIQEELW